MERRKLLWSLTGVSAVLGFMLTVQITSHPQSSTSFSSYIDLRTQVEELMQEHQILTREISKQRAQLAMFQASHGDGQDMQKALQRDAQVVAMEAGMTELKGPGIVITIKDDPKLPFDQQFAGQFATESDQELSQIVNDLFSNGAKAISINDQRLVTTSSIRLVQGLGGAAVLQVNGYPITQPYVIRATGDIGQMQAVLTVNDVVPILNLMQEDCIIRAYPRPSGVTVPKYDGPLPGTWAKEVGVQ